MTFGSLIKKTMMEMEVMLHVISLLVPVEKDGLFFISKDLGCSTHLNQVYKPFACCQNFQRLLFLIPSTNSYKALLQALRVIAYFFLAVLNSTH